MFYFITWSWHAIWVTRKSKIHMRNIENVFYPGQLSAEMSREALFLWNYIQSGGAEQQCKCIGYFLSFQKYIPFEMVQLRAAQWIYVPKFLCGFIKTHTVSVELHLIAQKSFLLCDLVLCVFCWRFSVLPLRMVTPTFIYFFLTTKDTCHSRRASLFHRYDAYKWTSEPCASGQMQCCHFRCIVIVATVFLQVGLTCVTAYHIRKHQIIPVEEKWLYFSTEKCTSFWP